MKLDTIKHTGLNCNSLKSFDKSRTPGAELRPTSRGLGGGRILVLSALHHSKRVPSTWGWRGLKTPAVCPSKGETVALDEVWVGGGSPSMSHTQLPYVRRAGEGGSGGGESNGTVVA